MAINVTLGEVKPQEVKPFPKLMIGVKGPWESQICFFEKYEKGMLIGPHEFGYADNFNMEDFTDYNRPVTIQNA